MEIDMTKKKLDIDISDWGLPNLAKKIDKLKNKYEKKIEKVSDTLLDDVFNDFDFEYGKLAIIVREAASEALNISLEDGAQIDLFTKPGHAIFCLPFCDQYPEWEVDVTEYLINEIDGCVCGDTNYIGEKYQEQFKTLSNNLKVWAKLIDDNLQSSQK
jgi:hypothetical protein